LAVIYYALYGCSALRRVGLFIILKQLQGFLVASNRQLPAHFFNIYAHAHLCQRCHSKVRRFFFWQAFEYTIAQSGIPLRQTQFLRIQRMIVLVQYATYIAATSGFVPGSLHYLVQPVMFLQPGYVEFFYCWVVVERLHGVSPYLVSLSFAAITAAK